MKRFYKEASFSQSLDPSAGHKIYAILLDGKQVKTPLKQDLIVSGPALAQASIDEWNAQEDAIAPDTMPVTQLLNTKLDKVQNNRSTIEDLLLGYFDTDLICYYTDAPPELLDAQKKAWQPYHEWFEKKYGQALVTTFGLQALRQNNEIAQTIEDQIKAMDDDRLTVLQTLVPATGSLVLSLAFMDGRQDLDKIMKACFVEEDHKAAIYNEDLHGPDPLIDKKKKALYRDIEGCFRYLNAL